MVVSFLATAVVIWQLSSSSIISGFVNLEQERAVKDVERIHQSFLNNQTALHNKTVDWANWDDLYDYVASPNEKFVQSNVDESSFTKMNVDLIMILDRSQRVVYSKAIPPKMSMATQSLPNLELLHQDLIKSGALDGSLDGKRSGIEVLANGDLNLTLSVRPIMPTSGTGAHRGWLVFGRTVDAEIASEVVKVNRQSVKIEPVKKNTPIPTEILENTYHGKVPYVRIANQSDLVGYTIVKDAYGHEALLIQSTMKRSYYEYGQAVISTLLWQLLGVGVVLCLMVLLIIERTIVSRIFRLESQVDSVHRHEHEELSSRISIEGKDEITSLAVHIKEMLEKLDGKSKELKESREVLRLHNDNLEAAILERTREMEHQAFHDKLTGLPNRALFMDRLDQAIRKMKRSRAGTVALFIDLDNFKLINDSLGHDMGDELLCVVADRLKRDIRPGDTVARLGGDEFTILLENLSGVEEGIAVAERILNSLRQPILLGGREAYAGGSIGVAYTTDPDMTSATLLKNADTAMYSAKADGKMNYRLFDDSMYDSALERLEVETALRRAVENQEIEVAYQPLINLDGGEMMGAEALARWTHPTRGAISPSEFIPIAEETGLIIPIGYWVLEEACRQARGWSDLYPGRDLEISVNLSGKQLQKPDVVERVREILDGTGLKPSCLKLEITESVLMEDREEVARKMHLIKALGVKLALDDFGTGYSSLSTLRAFPIDTLKVDRLFISQLGEEESADAIVEAIAAMARSMKMTVTGEGVENDMQEAIIRSLGCATGQGYLYDKPLTRQEFELRLRDHGFDTQTDAA
jgi:diguanylate cyclase (GGDEF)-like protein